MPTEKATTGTPGQGRPSIGADHQQLGEKVRDHLRELIVTGDLTPGTRLVERTVAAELGVSRIPVRDALNMLKGEGFLTEVPRRGVIVASLSRQDVDELFEVREALEVLSVRLAAERATVGDIRQLTTVVDEGRAALDAGDWAALASANQRFHDVITSIAHNRMLGTMLHTIEARLRWLLRQNDKPQLLFKEHEELLNAIAAGDIERATSASVRHIETSREVCHAFLFAAEEGVTEVTTAPS